MKRDIEILKTLDIEPIDASAAGLKQLHLLSNEFTLPALPGEPERSTDRLHLSDVLRQLELEIPQRPSNKRATQFSESLDVLFACGHLWEDALEYIYSKCYARRLGLHNVPEVERDDIVGSPDGVDWKNEIIIEAKFTFKSVKNGRPDNMRNWLNQVKGYCAMLDMDRVIFHVLYARGDYDKNFPGPAYRAYLLEFDQLAIDRNWQMVVNCAERMRKE